MQEYCVPLHVVSIKWIVHYNYQYPLTLKRRQDTYLAWVAYMWVISEAQFHDINYVNFVLWLSRNFHHTNYFTTPLQLFHCCRMWLAECQTHFFIVCLANMVWVVAHCGLSSSLPCWEYADVYQTFEIVSVPKRNDHRFADEFYIRFLGCNSQFYSHTTSSKIAIDIQI